MFGLLTRRIRLPNVIVFREYVRRPSSSRLQPVGTSTLTSSPDPKTAFVIKDESKQLAEPAVDPIAGVMTSIKSATNPLQLLDSVGVSKPEVNKMTSDQFMRTLHTLFGLHKATKDKISAAQIVGHPSFMILCRKLRNIAPSMDVSDNLNALKIISYLKIPANTELSLVLVSLLRHQINDLSLQEMVYADYLFSQLKPRLEKGEAIRAALPILFEIQLPIQFDPENATENVELLRFATSKMVSPETVGMIADSFPKRLGQLDVEKRKEILRMLCFAPNVPRTANELWNSCVLRNANMIPKLEINELVQTTAMIASKCQAEPIFYTDGVEKYLEKCVEAFIERDTDLVQTVHLQKLLKIISFKSDNLLRHIDNKISANIVSETLDTVFTIVQAYAMAGHQPPNWKEIILPAILKNVTDKVQNLKHPTWLKFTLQLILLDHFENEFVERVLRKEYLTNYMQRNNFSDSDYLKLVILYHEACQHGECRINHEYLQTVVGTYLGRKSDNPFQHALSNKLGTEQCLFDVRTKYGHCVQNLVKYDVGKRQFVSFDAVQRDSTGFAVLDQVKCTNSERLIAIDATPKHFYWTNCNELKNVYQQRRKQFQRKGIIVFEVPPKYWVNVPDTLEIKTDVLWQRIDNLLPLVR